MTEGDKIKAIIIDDEVGSIRTLESLLEEHVEDIIISGVAEEINEGVRLIRAHRPDLVFLDIQMRNGTGFDLLKKIGNRSFEVVFTTAYNDYAIRAFRFSAIDYLLKPINYLELKDAVRKVRQNLVTRQVNRTSILEKLLDFNEKDPSIAIAMEQSIEFIKVAEIVRLEANAAYTDIFLKDGRTITSSKHLKKYEEMLLDYNFFRSHHSHLINLGEVRRYVKSDGGYIEMNNNARVPLSRRRKDQFLNRAL